MAYLESKNGTIASAVVVLGALVGVPSAAQAREIKHASAVLDYAVPADLAACPDRATFASSVATRLGYDPFADAGAGAQTLTVRFRRDRVAVVAALRLADAADKTLVSETGACDEVAAAAAFAAATLLDPRAMFPKPAAPAAPPAGPSLDTHSPGTWPWYEPPALPPTPKPEAPPAEPLRGHLGVVGVGCIGCAPSPNPGAAVFAGIYGSRLGVDLGARADVPASATAASGRIVRSSLVVGELFPHVRFGVLRPGLLGTVGAFLGDSEGERQGSTWAAAGARFGVDVPLGSSFFVRGALDGLFVLDRVSLRVDGRELWSTPAFVASVGFGAGVTL